MADEAREPTLEDGLQDPEVQKIVARILLRYGRLHKPAVLKNSPLEDLVVQLGDLLHKKGIEFEVYT